MAQRKLTVYAGSGKGYAPIPQIILQGNWLEELGYHIGDKVTVDCQTGKMIITKEERQTELEN